MEVPLSSIALLWIECCSWSFSRRLRGRNDWRRRSWCGSWRTPAGIVRNYWHAVWFLAAHWVEGGSLPSSSSSDRPSRRSHPPYPNEWPVVRIPRRHACLSASLDPRGTTRIPSPRSSDARPSTRRTGCPYPPQTLYPIKIVMVAREGERREAV